MRVRKEAEPVLREAKLLGFQVCRTRNCHWRFSMPGTAPIYYSGTPSCRRANMNCIAQLRRAAATAAARP